MSNSFTIFAHFLKVRVMYLRKVFQDFDPTSVANLDEERLISIRVHGGPLLSEPKVRAIVANAKQLLKVGIHLPLA